MIMEELIKGIVIGALIVIILGTMTYYFGSFLVSIFPNLEPKEWVTIKKKIIDKKEHEGWIDVKSTPGKGSIFRV